MNSKTKWILTSVLIQGLIYKSSSSFIDINQPILIRDRNIGESYFSYSITASSPSNAGLSSKIYVGAPKGNGSVGFESGIVWECRLELESYKISCNVLSNIVASKTSTNEYPECCPRQRGRCYKEITDKIWLGNSLTSVNNGNDLVSCGYRWTIEEKGSVSRRLNGICYHTSQSKNSKGGGTRTIRLKPPLHPDDQYTKTIGEYNDHLWFYGEFGFSSVYDSSRDHLLIGAPGHFHWRGTVILYEGFNNIEDSTCSRLDSVNALEHKQVKSMDYLGYAVTSGSYYRLGEFVFAVGAPRGGSKSFLNGYVAILTVSSAFVNFNSHISFAEWIFGSQLGSYFGSVLASADVNGDQRHELIIGAPLFSTRYSAESFDEGCVFIYTNKGSVGKGLYLNERLCSSKDKGGRFGSAITNLGDINHDGYEDIAISAPGAKSGSGAVYIYYGSPDKLYDNPENPIIIYASDVSKDLKGFGSSLFGNVDMDGNRTPDLLIGSFTSKQIAVYRTRPKLAIEVKINGYFINNRNIEKFKREEKGFVINACLQIKRRPDVEGQIKIWVEITADSDRIGTGRFNFLESNKRTLLLPIEISKGQFKPLEIQVQLISDLQPDDKQSIAFHWNVWYNDTLNLLQDVRVFDISGNQAEKVVPAKRPFCSHCPAPMEMEHTHSIPLADDNCDSDGDPTCSSDLKVTARVIDESNKVQDDLSVKNHVIGSEDPKFLEIIVTNTRETAYAPTVELTAKFKTQVTAKNLLISLYEQRRGCAPFSYVSNDLEKKYSFVCEKPLHQGKTMQLKFKVIFDNLRATPLDEFVTFQFAVYPRFHPKQLHDFQLQLKLTSDFKLQFKNSENEPATAILLTNSKVTQSFTNSYKIANPGKSPLDSVKLMFTIPVNRTVDGKDERVLRIAEPRPKELSCSIDDPMGFAIFENTENLASESDKPFLNSTGPVVSRRRRRQVDNNEEAKNAKSIISTGKTIKIGCEEPTDWKCATVTCLITVPLHLKKVMTIDLRLSLINRIANQLIPENTREIIVMTKGEASVFDDKRFTQNAVSNTRLDLTMEEGLPAWIILVSGAGGLVIFLLMSFCLFKCGFFRRKTKEDLQALKARAEEEDLLARNFPNVEESEVAEHEKFE